MLDIMRGLAVFLAMVDHVKVQFVPDFHHFIPLTRLATPCFIILFGAMVEIAYLKKVRSGRPLQAVRERMFARLITCWGLAILLTIAAVVSGNMDFEAGWKSVVGLGLGRFNEIFLIYAALFAVLIGILPLITRFGSASILAVACIGWALQPVWPQILGESAYPASFLLGAGNGYGPGLLPAMTFLGFGLAVGEMLTGRRGPLLPAVVLLIAVVVFAMELSHGPFEAGRRFLAHRWTNHPGYYAVGILAFAGMACTLMLAHRIKLLRRPLQVVGIAGTQTLFIYGAGNLVLNALPMTELPRAVGAPVAILFLAGLIVLALAGPSRRNALGLGLPAAWGRVYEGFRNAITGRTAPSGQ